MQLQNLHENIGTDMDKVLLQVLLNHFGALQGRPLLLTHCAAHFAETRGEGLRLQDGRRRFGGFSGAEEARGKLLLLFRVPIGRRLLLF